MAASPACAQQSFFEKLFGINPQPAPAAPQRVPAAAPTPSAPAPASPPAAALTSTARLRVLPPRRPAEPASVQASAGPTVVAAAEPPPVAPRTVTAAVVPAAPAPPEPLTQAAMVDRANAYFTNLSTLVAEFTQINADGRRIGGTIYLQRPGKVRFDYDAPSTLQIVADGSSVAVRDRKLATQDLYSISQTPLKFLLRERVNLGQDIKITAVGNDGDGIRIDLEDRSTLGGTSRIMLYFDARIETLQQWRIVDAQGYQTTVMLAKAERSRRLDQSMFVINQIPIINENSSR